MITFIICGGYLLLHFSCGLIAAILGLAKRHKEYGKLNSDDLGFSLVDFVFGPISILFRLIESPIVIKKANQLMAKINKEG